MVALARESISIQRGEMTRSYSGHDFCFRCEGRVDLARPEGPVLIWQASRVVFAFTGDLLGFDFEVLEGAVGLEVTIDGVAQRLSLRSTGAHQLQLKAVGAGPHHAVVTKISEADAGWVALRGITVAGELVDGPPAGGALKFEFFGDSITAAACSEDGAVDQWEDRTVHNALAGYAAFAAGDFGAEHRNIAVSGMGICTGYVPQRAGEIWDRLYPRADSVRAALTAWTPDIVFVNWGENDHAHSSEFKYPFPEYFARDYVAVVRRIREAYPFAQLVLLRGGMAGGANGRDLGDAWETARATLAKGDPRLHAFVFTHWAELHPRATDHRKMADELVAWLRAQPLLASKTN
jgi:lysophospholipase L1-like esterase